MLKGCGACLPACLPAVPTLITPVPPLQLQDGVQTLEAMLYTVGLVNRDPHLLPGIKLGLLAYDSCDNPTHALEQSLDFVKGEA